jgi:hypothetical protein
MIYLMVTGFQAVHLMDPEKHPELLIVNFVKKLV